MLVSIVVPVYRTEQDLIDLAGRTQTTMQAAGIPYELVFVDDNSPNATWDILQSLQASDPTIVTVVRLMRNFGQHNALMCGFRHARGDVIVTIDDDLQNPPEEIPGLLDALHQGGYDLVYGAPDQKKHAVMRNMGSRVVNMFYRMVFNTDATVTSFRAIRRELLLAILTYNLNFTFIDGLLAWNTQRVGEVIVSHRPRERGRSGYSIAKLVQLALNLFTNFSLLPLQVASVVGLLASCAGLLAGVFFLVKTLAHDTSVPGYSSIIVAVMTLGGLQLLAIGIIGEYIGRLHLNVNRKPQYTVREVLWTGSVPETAEGPPGCVTAREAPAAVRHAPDDTHLPGLLAVNDQSTTIFPRKKTA